MCGRYYIDIDEKEFQEIVREAQERSQDSEISTIKTGEIFPTNIVPILQMDKGKHIANAMKWGFPRFDGKGEVINARSETVFDKPMFRKSVMERRCLIPCTGFFEWKTDGQRKIKTLFARPDQSILYMAGIYNCFEDTQGKKQPCFTILTTAPNTFMQEYHNRMPVVLNSDEADEWLSDNVDFSALFDRSRINLTASAV